MELESSPVQDVGDATPDLPWRDISELEPSDDKHWFLRRDGVGDWVIDGPRATQNHSEDEEDGWQWFAPCESPPVRARELQQAQCPNCLNDGCHCATCKSARELQQAQVVCPRCRGRQTIDVNVDVDDSGGSIGEIEPCPQCASDDEEEEYVVAMLSKLLAEIAVILKGPEPALTRWSYHDLPEMVRQLKAATPQSSAPVVDEAMIEVAAKALWDSAPTKHRLLAKAGYPTDWESQVAGTKRDYRNQAQAVLTAALESALTGRGS